jgi:hypothetical protein
LEGLVEELANSISICVRNEREERLQEWAEFSVDTLRASGMRKNAFHTAKAKV